MLARLDSEIRTSLKKAFHTNHEAARILRFLMTPAAVAAYTLAAWRIGEDMNWTGEFFISSGLLSHWQVWIALGIGMQTAAGHLDRVLKSEDAPLRDEVVLP